MDLIFLFNVVWIIEPKFVCSYSENLTEETVVENFKENMQSCNNVLSCVCRCLCVSDFHLFFTSVWENKSCILLKNSEATYRGEKMNIP